MNKYIPINYSLKKLEYNIYNDYTLYNHLLNILIFSMIKINFILFYQNIF